VLEGVYKQAKEENHLNNASKDTAGFWPSVIAVPVLSVLAAWQFYLFATFKSVDGLIDIQGGRLHLWIAIATTLLASVVAFFVLSVWLRYDKKSELHIT
jgi:hypothetical protein